MESLTHQNLTWYNLVRPSAADLRSLQEKYGFHELDIEDCLSEHERPKIDEYEEYLFIGLHIPYFHTVKRRILKEEVHLFVGSNFLISLHEGNLVILNDFWEQLKQSSQRCEELLGQGSGYVLYELISKFFDSGFPLIDAINREMRALEGILFGEEQGEKVLRTVLELKRNIIAMRRILLPQRPLIAALEHKSKRLLPAELDIYFDDVQDAIERQWSQLETAKEVIEALQGSHESWIRNRTDRVIRILTVFSVTMLPLNVITGFYGMNVLLPHADDPSAFVSISIVGFLVGVSALAYFAWKRWL